MTRSPIPKTKAEEIRIQINPFLESRTLPDEFTLNRFKRDIEMAKSVDAVNAYLALGTLAVLEWDEELLDLSYQNTIRLDASSETYEQYATSLQMLGKYPEAAMNARLASEKNPTDLTCLRRAISYSFIAGEIMMAEQLCDKYALRAPGSPLDRSTQIRHANIALRSSNTTEEVVKKCNAVAFQMLREKQIAFRRIRYESDLQDSLVMLFIEIIFDEAGVSALDRELGDRLFDEVEEFHPGKYWIGLVQAEIV